MNALSPWAAAAAAFLEKEVVSLYQFRAGIYTFDVYPDKDTVWIQARWPKGGNILFRAAYSPGADLQVSRKRTTENSIDLQLSSVMGLIEIQISVVQGERPVLRYTTRITPACRTMIPFWPRDIIFPSLHGSPENTNGKIHLQQAGTRSGVLYVSMTKPKTGSLLYLQNLTALGDYCEQTGTSCAEVVGGKWPELGLSLPTSADHPLEPGKTVVISDALIAFEPTVPTDEPTITEQYLNLLAEVYLQLPAPATNYHHWPDTLQKGLKDLIHNHGCWTQVEGQTYLNAYLCDYATPPEIMVQLAILLPLIDYSEWKGEKQEITDQIKAVLPSFFNDELKTIMRWLPAAEGKLEGEEEQKRPMVMDSWYLHHPLINLSRLALKGDKTAEKLFLASLDFAINVAQHFKYHWPVFYKMDTLEVVKEETEPGKGGEKDVAGMYAHVMLQAWELTGKKKYLQEAENAAKTLKGLGFDLFYQANNTAFAAGALLKLYKVTRNKTYLRLSYTCLANIFRNTRLWDCNYGYGKSFPSFFTLFPLNDAPYTASYEEQEVFCILHAYLKLAEEEDVLSSVILLSTEYIRHLINRAPYYYPPMLPKAVLSDEVKIGEVDANVWVALEDLHDGWEKNGAVGQEVYGAGNAFGIVPRHYIRIPRKDFLIFIDYPLTAFSRRNKAVSFTITGDSRLNCRLMIIKAGKDDITHITVALNGVQQTSGRKRKDGHIEYVTKGGDRVVISFREDDQA